MEMVAVTTAVAPGMQTESRAIAGAISVVGRTSAPEIIFGGEEEGATAARAASSASEVRRLEGPCQSLTATSISGLSPAAAMGAST